MFRATLALIAVFVAVTLAGLLIAQATGGFTGIELLLIILVAVAAVLLARKPVMRRATAEGLPRR